MTKDKQDVQTLMLENIPHNFITVFENGCFGEFDIDFGFRCEESQWSEESKESKGYTRTISKAELIYIAINDKDGNELKRIEIKDLLNHKPISIMELPFNTRVVDTFSRFEGNTVARVEYATGQIDYLIQPQCTDKNVMPSAQWIDVSRLSPLDTVLRQGINKVEAVQSIKELTNDKHFLYIGSDDEFARHLLCGEVKPIIDALIHLSKTNDTIKRMVEVAYEVINKES